MFHRIPFHSWPIVYAGPNLAHELPTNLMLRQMHIRIASSSPLGCALLGAVLIVPTHVVVRLQPEAP